MDNGPISLEHVKTFSEALKAKLSTYPDFFFDEPFRRKDLNKWILCFCTLDFNVDIGPEFECIYPPVEFSEQDLKTICFSSFPELSYYEDADAFHTFRFKPTSKLKLRRSSLLSRNALRESDEYLYAYVIFKQQEDNTKSRHYLQKSITLISQYEFPAIFEKCVRLASQYSTGPAMIATLQTAASNIASWPNPEYILKKFNEGSSKRKHIDLPYMGEQIRLLITVDPMLPLAESSEGRSDIYLFARNGSWARLVRKMKDLKDLFIIYERIILGMPIVIGADTPSTCSKLVTNAIDLIKPIPYTGLVREYITAQTDIESLNIISESPVPGIIGCTNPFITEMVKKFNDFVFLEDISTRTTSHSFPSLNVNILPVFPDLMTGANAHHHGLTVDLLYPVTATIDFQMYYMNKMLKSIGIQTARGDHKQEKFLVRDKAFIRKVEEMLESGASDQMIDKFIRLYFINLTAKILAPIKRYLFVANKSSRRFDYSEYMYYFSMVVSGMNESGISRKATIDSTGKSLGFWESFFRYRSTKVNAARVADSPDSLNTSSLQDLETDNSELSSGLVLGNSGANDQLQLFIEAVKPDDGLYFSLERSYIFYTILLRSANFEAWCFM
ncbi:hypothetical protein V1511DRAFT_455146 [Dipodascopsis uninucleata]